MRKFFITCGTAVTVLLASVSASAAKPGSLPDNPSFVRGNMLYENARYEDALEQYLTALQSGWQAWELYYNTGNTYYRLVDYPRAVLYYEKALKLAPDNADIHRNLALAEAKNIDRFNPLPSFFLYSWKKRVCMLLGSTGWAVLIMVLAALVLFSAGYYLYAPNYKSKRLGFFSGIICAVLLAVCMFFGYGRYKEDRVETAVIMQPSVNVKTLPEEKSETKFIIHEGSKVYVEDRIAGFCKVRVKNGSRGWVPAGCLEEI